MYRYSTLSTKSRDFFLSNVGATLHTSIYVYEKRKNYFSAPHFTAIEGNENEREGWWWWWWCVCLFSGARSFLLCVFFLSVVFVSCLGL